MISSSTPILSKLLTIFVYFQCHQKNELNLFRIEKAYKEFEMFSKLEDELNNRDKFSSMFTVLNADEQAVQSTLLKTPTLDDSIELSDDEADTNRAQIDSNSSNTIGLADSTAMWENPANFCLSNISNEVETGFATVDKNWVRNI